MAAGSFRIKTKNDWNTIYFRFKQGKSFDLEISTGVQIPKGRWSQAKQEVLITGEVNYKELKTLVKTHWKTILIIVLVIYLFTSYTDIKSGIMDAWSGK
jgi:hypothetical protein